MGILFEKDIVVSKPAENQYSFGNSQNVFGALKGFSGGMLLMVIV